MLVQVIIVILQGVGLFLDKITGDAKGIHKELKEKYTFHNSYK
jgi:hypothetical protein